MSSEMSCECGVEIYTLAVPLAADPRVTLGDVAAETT